MCITLVTLSFNANAQMRQRGSTGTSSIAGAYNMPSATMHGTLKKITGKDIIINVEGDQLVTIDRTRKTKFLRAGKEIKPADIAVGSVVTVDVNEDPQLKPLALNVMVESGPTDPEPSPTATSTGSAAADQQEPAPAATETPSKAPPAKPAAEPNR